jgi:hypothetical protein
MAVRTDPKCGLKKKQEAKIETAGILEECSRLNMERPNKKYWN